MRENGQSLFEVVIALAISAVIIIALVSLVTNSIRNAVFSNNDTQAGILSQKTIEWLRGQRDENIATFLSAAQTPSYCMENLDFNQTGECQPNDFIPGTVFLRQVDFSLGTVSGKTVVTASVKIKWNDSLGDHEVDNSTNFTDWRQR